MPSPAARRTTRWPRWPSPRDAVLLALAAAASGLHVAWPEVFSPPVLYALFAGVALGLLLSPRGAPAAIAGSAHTTHVVAQDIQTLRQAFEVLQRQVEATIGTSEAAVVSMMERMNRVHANAHDLHGRIGEAVRRSQALSSDSLQRAGQHGQAVSALAEHQKRTEAAQREYRQRVSAVAEEVRQLRPLAATIGEIARETNLLAINATIEAARAGREGAGFKVVAAEVRRLSTQTSEAARQVTDGIAAAAAAIDAEMQGIDTAAGDSASARLGEIAGHIDEMSQTLGHVVPYLGELSTHMDSGMATVTADIIDTLGDMQFQDINRQLLEQISGALGSLSEHFAQVYALIDGDAPPPPMMLEELLAAWTENYVMHAQRVAHAVGLERPDGGNAAQASVAAVSPAENAPQPSLTLAGAHGPRIELF